MTKKQRKSDKTYCSSEKEGGDGGRRAMYMDP